MTLKQWRDRLDNIPNDYCGKGWDSICASDYFDPLVDLGNFVCICEQSVAIDRGWA